MENDVRPRWMTIVGWGLRVLMAALFGFAAFKKLTADPEMVKQFGLVGLGQWFRYFVALIEIAGVVAILTPATVRYGAFALLAVDVGAFVVQLTILHGDVIHTIVIGLILGAVLWLQRGRSAASTVVA